MCCNTRAQNIVTVSKSLPFVVENARFRFSVQQICDKFTTGLRANVHDFFFLVRTNTRVRFSNEFYILRVHIPTRDFTLTIIHNMTCRSGVIIISVHGINDNIIHKTSLNYAYRYA